MKRNGKRVLHAEDRKECKRKRKENKESSEETKRKAETVDTTLCETTSFPKLPEEMIIEIGSYLRLNDLHSLAKVSPEFEFVETNPSLHHNVHVDMWKGDDSFSSVLKPPNSDSINILTLHCQQDPSTARTRVTLSMLKGLKKISGLKHLRIEGALLGVNVFCNLAQSVETLELIDCTSSSNGWTKTKKTNLRNLYINDCSTFNDQIYANTWITPFLCDDLTKFFSGLHKFACPFGNGCSLQVFSNTFHVVHTIMLTDTNRSLEEFEFCKQNDPRISEYLVPVYHDYVEMFITRIARHKYVKVLRFGGWDCISDETVKKIFNIDSLREVHLDACPYISDAALYNIPDSHSIKLLNLTGCSGVSARAVQQLRSRCTNLTVMF